MFLPIKIKIHASFLYTVLTEELLDTTDEVKKKKQLCLTLIVLIMRRFNKVTQIDHDKKKRRVSLRKI